MATKLEHTPKDEKDIEIDGVVAFLTKQNEQRKFLALLKESN
jgi:hypothetical protein